MSEEHKDSFRLRDSLLNIMSYLQILKKRRILKTFQLFEYLVKELYPHIDDQSLYTLSEDKETRRFYNKVYQILVLIRENKNKFDPEDVKENIMIVRKNFNDKITERCNELFKYTD